MLTRRAVLTGTAAASIGAIASAHGVASAATSSDGFDVPLGDLEGGALGAFHKIENGFGVFMKWDKTRAEVFYKQTEPGVVGVFHKSFLKGWSPVSSVFLKISIDDASAFFQKVDQDGAEFFLKIENGDGLRTTFVNGEDGVGIETTLSSD